MSGASVRNSARVKGHEKGGSTYAKVGSSLRSPPGYSRASTPQTRVCLLYCFVLSSLTLQGLSPTPSHSPWKGVKLQLQLIKFLGIIGVFKSKPLRWLSNSPDKFIWTPTAMHTIVYSLPAVRGTGRFRSYLNGLVVFPTFFNLSLNLAIRCSWSGPQSAPGLVFVDCIQLLHLWLQRI